MNIILFDGAIRNALLPLTYTRPVGNLRVGILTINKKWEQFAKATVSYLTAPYLQSKFPAVTAASNIIVSGGVCPSDDLMNAINSLALNQALVQNERFIAAKVPDDKVTDAFDFKELTPVEYNGKVIEIAHTWDIFAKNGDAMQMDYDMLTTGRVSAPISDSNTVIGDQIFLEEGAKVEGAILNTKTGPIYVGKNAEIMEGSLVRGGLALCENATLKMGAKVYGPTTIGPHCKAGGEISNSVMYGYSNKGHDGFIGNTVIGEWCNLGADTNTSNLKNNYSKVRLWSYDNQRFADTGLQFCGLVMGDHSKCGINTMFNTGTVVGVSANIYGAGFPRNFVPSFAWGGASGMMEFRLSKAEEVAEAMMGRRKIEFDETEHQILQWVYDNTANFRKNLK